MSRSFVPAGLICLVIVISAACISERIQAQTPPAAPQLSAEERATKIAERDRLWKQAGELRAAGKLDEALERLASNIQLQRALFRDKTVAEVEALEQIAEVQRDRQHWAEARAAAAQALAICEKATTRDNWRTIDARLIVADVERWSKFTSDQRAQLVNADRLLAGVSRLWEQGKYREAVPLAEQVLALRRQVLGDAHRLTGDAWNRLGALHNELRNAKDAELFHRQALETRKQALGETHPDYAQSLGNLALLYYFLGDYARAEPLFKQALEIRKNALGEADSDYANSLNSLAVLYDDMGDYARAEPLFKQALEICKQALGESHPNYALNLNNLAALYKAMGDYARAEPLYKQALEVMRKARGEAHPDYARSLYNLAVLYDDMGNYARAEPLYKQALEILKQALGESHPSYATSLNGLAGLYHAMGDYARAEPLYKQALDVERKALGEANPAYSTSLNNLAGLYLRIGDYTRAEPLYKQVLEIRKQALGESHPDYALSLNNLATLYYRIGDYARAEPLNKQALKIRKKALGEAHPSYATSLENLASDYMGMGDYARAEPLYKQAVDIRRKALGEAHPDYAYAIANLGFLQLTLGRTAEAEKLLRQAVEINRKSLDLTAAVQSEQQQLAMAGSVRVHLDNYLTGALAANTAPAEIYAEVAAWKGSVSAQQQLLRARQRALAGDPNSQLGQFFAQLDAQTRRLAALTRYTPKPDEAAKVQMAIDALSESLNVLQQRLSRLDPDFHRVWAERTISPEQLRQALPADAALIDLLEYWHYIPRAEKGGKATRERRLVAFVLRHDEPITCVQLGTTAPVGSLVDAWRTGYGRLRSGEEKPPGVELRRLLWEPLAPHLTGVNVVLVSPDGALAQLPWGALPGDKPGTFLIEERAIAVIAIPQMLPELLARDAHGGPPASLLLAGDIDYGGDPGAAVNRGGTRAAVGRMRDGRPLQFQKLDAAQAELASIERRYHERVPAALVATLDGSGATEAAFRGEAPKHSWLHVITHGFFAPDGSAGLSASPAKPADEKPVLAGIGAGLDVQDGHCRVTQLVAGGAAIRDGRLKVGDEIVAVAQADGDSKLAGGKELPAIVAMIRGPLGSTVRVRVRPRDKPDQEIELTLVRGALPTQTEPANPGLMSGLVFAGANTPPAEGKDDGILTALEVASLDLSKVDTVVLSACETGLGHAAGGEGLLGLQRSFQVAGAKTVVASLWKVPDAATSTLMQRFYENLWDRKMGKLAALREAQIYVLHDQDESGDGKSDKGNRGLTVEQDQPADAGALPPFYWAAFVLSGDWR